MTSEDKIKFKKKEREKFIREVTKRREVEVRKGTQLNMKMREYCTQHT